METNQRRMHTVSVVVPVYRGARTLPALMAELGKMTEPSTTRHGARFHISEVLLVHDCGPDNSDVVIRQLVAEHAFVRPVWLSRNFGQHPATLAGMASTGGDWIVTLDEDGQHDPAFIPDMIDAALSAGATVVYAEPTNPPPHSWLRNITSRIAKWMFVRLLSSGSPPAYHSYRLVIGELGRSLAAYSGPGIYLDVALRWITDRVTTCPVSLRFEGERPSGYSWRRLASHFWRLVLTSGTRPLRVMSVVGALFATIGFLAAAFLVVGRVADWSEVDVGGWTSLSVITLVGTGLVLFTLGVAAEYIGATTRMAMGEPPYLVVSDDADGPLSDRQA